LPHEASRNHTPTKHELFSWDTNNKLQLHPNPL
jgi:hypothetical protein